MISHALTSLCVYVCVKLSVFTDRISGEGSVISHVMSVCLSVCLSIVSTVSFELTVF